MPPFGCTAGLVIRPLVFAPKQQSPEGHSKPVESQPTSTDIYNALRSFLRQIERLKQSSQLPEMQYYTNFLILFFYIFSNKEIFKNTEIA